MVAAFVRLGDSVLLCRRSSGGSQGLWELPGGKLEAGETPREGLIREIQEELALSCLPGQLIFEGTLPATGKQYLFMVYHTSLEASPVTSSAHDSLSWVTRDQLHLYNLAPLDVPVLGGLMDKYLWDPGLESTGQRIAEPGSSAAEPAERKGDRR